MIRKFKFFDGITDNSFVFDFMHHQYNRETIDAVETLTRIVSEEVERHSVEQVYDMTIDPDMFEESSPTIDINDDYLNFWYNIGNNNRA